MDLEGEPVMQVSAPPEVKGPDGPQTAQQRSGFRAELGFPLVHLPSSTQLPIMVSAAPQRLQERDTEIASRVLRPAQKREIPLAQTNASVCKFVRQRGCGQIVVRGRFEARFQRITTVFSIFFNLVRQPRQPLDAVLWSLSTGFLKGGDRRIPSSRSNAVLLTYCASQQPLAIDLLNPSHETEIRKHKLKRLVP